MRPPHARSRVSRASQSLGRFVLRRFRQADLPHPVKPSLKVRTFDVRSPRFPAIDAHAHLKGTFGSRWTSLSADRLVDAMDAAGLAATIALDGGYGASLTAEIRRLQARHPDRFAVFANIDEEALSQRTDFGAIEAERLAASVRAGARGLKIWKSLGLSIRDADGELIGLDDARLAPLWSSAADLKIPVLIHFADPAAFFEPLSQANERWLELQLHPDWHQYPPRKEGDRRDPRPPSFGELHRQFQRMLRAHRSTTFIGAHMASSAEDLARLGELLEEHPNLYVDTAARLNELGRQPYTARAFLLKYQDRVLFGTDVGPDPKTCRLYYRFFETQAEYVPYSASEFPRSGNWRIYGIDLPDDVLRKIYVDNASRLIAFGR